jgi:hypothetical protein
MASGFCHLLGSGQQAASERGGIKIPLYPPLAKGEEKERGASVSFLDASVFIKRIENVGLTKWYFYVTL